MDIKVGIEINPWFKASLDDALALFIWSYFYLTLPYNLTYIIK